jgi:Domain of unknown function (DUF4383)
MSTAQRLSQVFGIVFVIIALAGMLATGVSMDASMATAPRLLGLFSLNLLHNIVHLLFGAWGLAASRTFAGSKTYLFGAGAIYLVLAICGFVAPTGFGLVPLGGADIGLHAALGVVLLAAGAATSRVTVEATA